MSNVQFYWMIFFLGRLINMCSEANCRCGAANASASQGLLEVILHIYCIYIPESLSDYMAKRVDHLRSSTFVALTKAGAFTERCGLSIFSSPRPL